MSAPIAAYTPPSILDVLLKIIDSTVASLAAVAGLFVFIAPPPTLLREVQIPFLIALCGVFLMLGGLSSGFGRLVDIWIFETAGIVSIATGAGIYLCTISTAMGRELGVGVAVCLIAVAFALLARRYVELQKLLRTGKAGMLRPRLAKFFHLFARKR